MMHFRYNILSLSNLILNYGLYPLFYASGIRLEDQCLSSSSSNSRSSIIVVVVVVVVHFAHSTLLAQLYNTMKLELLQ